MDSVAGFFLSTINAVDDKMAKNQYYQISHPAQEILRKSDINTKKLTDKWLTEYRNSKTAMNP